MNATEARKASENNKEALAEKAHRNALKKAREERRRKAEWEKNWFESEQKEYEDGIKKAIKAGHRSFSVYVNSVKNQELTVDEMMDHHSYPDRLREIWAGLRKRGFSIEIKMKSEYDDGRSFYEGISDTDPFTTYTYTAVVSW